jgi:hypothetical protein
MEWRHLLTISSSIQSLSLKLKNDSAQFFSLLSHYLSPLVSFQSLSLIFPRDFSETLSAVLPSLATMISLKHMTWVMRDDTYQTIGFKNMSNIEGLSTLTQLISLNSRPKGSHYYPNGDAAPYAWQRWDENDNRWPFTKLIPHLPLVVEVNGIKVYNIFLHF